MEERNEKREKGPVTFDDVIVATGYVGRYQVIQSIQIMAYICSVAIPLLNIVFLGYEVPHQCRESSNDSSLNDELDVTNVTSVVYEECSIRITTNGSSGEVVKKSFPCLFGNEYSTPRKISFVSEWDLVCDQAGYAELSQTVLMIGQGFGGILFSTLADRYGRKPLYVWCLYGLLGFGIGTAYAPNVAVFIVFRFSLGALQQGAGLAAYTMFVELLPTFHRSLAAVIGGFLWVGSLLALAGLAYLMQEFDWRDAQLVYVSVSVYVVILYWTLDESIRWLVANGKLDEARRLIIKAAKMNNADSKQALDTLDSFILEQDLTCSREVLTDKELTKPLLHKEEEINVNGNPFECSHKSSDPAEEILYVVTDISDNKEEECLLSEQIDGLVLKGASPSEKPLTKTNNGEPILSQNVKKQFAGSLENSKDQVADVMLHFKKSKNYTILDLFYSKPILKVTIIICYIWTVNSITYYGLFLTASSLAGNRFLNFFLFAIVESPGVLIIQFLYNRTGRKEVSIIFHTLAGVFLITSVTILGAAGHSEAGQIASNVFNLLGKFAISASFNALFVYGPELFPTNLRTAGLGLSSASARIGGMVAPYSRILSREVIWGPGALFGTMCLLAAFLVRYLPETKGKELPTTIEEMEKSITEAKRKKPKQNQNEICK